MVGGVMDDDDGELDLDPRMDETTYRDRMRAAQRAARGQELIGEHGFVVQAVAPSRGDRFYWLHTVGLAEPLRQELVLTTGDVQAGHRILAIVGRAALESKVPVQPGGEVPLVGCRAVLVDDRLVEGRDFFEALWAQDADVEVVQIVWPGWLKRGGDPGVLTFPSGPSDWPDQPVWASSVWWKDDE